MKRDLGIRCNVLLESIRVHLIKQIQGRLLQFFISVFRNARVVSSSTTTLYKTWVFSETSQDLFRRLVLRQKLGSNSLVFSIDVVLGGHHRAQQIDRRSALQTAQKENTDRIPFTRTFQRYSHAIRSFFSKTLYYF